jgi:hypothetical protein
MQTSGGIPHRKRLAILDIWHHRYVHRLYLVQTELVEGRRYSLLYEYLSFYSVAYVLMMCCG